MMTEQRKRRLKNKIQASRTRLMSSNPFFALLLMYLKFVAVPEMKKISTNSRCIYFSPDFLDKLYDYEVDYILCHQIMHIICGHIWRPYDRNSDDYHFACDIQINSILTEHGFTEERYPHLGYVYKSVQFEERVPSEMTPEEISNLIPYSLYAFDEKTRSRFLVDSDVWWDQKDDSGSSGEIIIDIPKLDNLTREKIGVAEGISYADDTELKQEWQSRASITALSRPEQEDNNNGAGDVPDFVKRIIDKMREPTVDWKKILNNFIQERICDYSFSPPDRRFLDTGFFLPDLNDSEFISKEIWFMVDTSGSVQDEDLGIIYSEIRGAIEQFGAKLKGKLGFFDAAVTTPLPFESISELMSIIPYGGGGTDFCVIFDYIRRNCIGELPACIVIFTDGYGPYPPEEQTMNIPVLWLINNFEITPPFGKTTRVLPNTEII